VSRRQSGGVGVRYGSTGSDTIPVPNQVAYAVEHPLLAAGGSQVSASPHCLDSGTRLRQRSRTTGGGCCEVMRPRDRHIERCFQSIATITNLLSRARDVAPPLHWAISSKTE
jgi:hypothetical protein